MSDIVERIERMLGYVEGINDERDSVPLLLEVRRAWPEVRAEIERLRDDKATFEGWYIDAVKEIKRLREEGS